MPFRSCQLHTEEIVVNEMKLHAGTGQFKEHSVLVTSRSQAMPNHDPQAPSPHKKSTFTTGMTQKYFFFKSSWPCCKAFKFEFYFTELSTIKPHVPRPVNLSFCNRLPSISNERVTRGPLQYTNKITVSASSTFLADCTSNKPIRY